MFSPTYTHITHSHVLISDTLCYNSKRCQKISQKCGELRISKRTQIPFNVNTQTRTDSSYVFSEEEEIYSKKNTHLAQEKWLHLYLENLKKITYF